MQNIRDREALAVGKMLNLASQGSSGGAVVDFNDQWKVLVYDDHCRDVISPLMNIGALRQKGVTLHMLLHSEREPIADAPAVYFVRPNEENIKRIVEDCAKQLYRTIYLNFITRIDRSLMEKLAQDLVAVDGVSMIAKIYDQYLNVVALEPYLFTLNIMNSFMAYNEPSLNEAQIRGFMGQVSTGVLSMIRVLGALPVIRAPPGGAAEMLAMEVNNMLKENISARGPAQPLFEDCLMNDRSRPLLLIFDRSCDLFPVLQHNSTYQALIKDLLDYKLNRVTIDVKEKGRGLGGGTTGKKKTYDLNTQSDPFLRRYAGAPFPEAIEANESELAEVSQQESAIRSRPDFALIDSAAHGGSNASSLEGKGRDLSEAIEKLPEILGRKANLEAHTNILHAVMQHIAAREVPTYFELEQSVLTSGRSGADRSSVLATLRDGSKGTIADKARLLAVLSVAMATEGLSKSQAKQIAEEYDAAFSQGCAAIVEKAASSAADQTIPGAGTAGGGAAVAKANPAGDALLESPIFCSPASEETVKRTLAAIAFLRRLLALQASSMSGFGSGGAAGGMPSSSSNAILSSFLTTATSRASSLMAKAASFFTKFTPFYVTRVVYNLAEGRSCPEDDTFCLLDPRWRGGAGGGGADAYRGQKFSDVIVFVVGGGSYSEFYNLQELLKDAKVSSSGGGAGSASAAASGSGSGSALRNILYGCSDLISGDDFLAQLDLLVNGKGSTGGISSTGS